MKKLLASAIAAATLLAAVVPMAHASAVNSTFGVSVSLTAICTANNSGATTLGFGTYTAFQTAANTGSVALTFNCTRGLTAPTFSFDATNGTATGGGMLAGLNYSLVATNGTTTPGTVATASTTTGGTADTRSVTVTGTMAGGQAGDCTTSTAAACSATASHNRTLTVTY